MASKANYVLSQKQTEHHTCHWPNCLKQVPPAMWGCRPHWFRLPNWLRAKIWRAYRHECGAEGEKADGDVYDIEDVRLLERQAVDLWQNRDSRNRDCYDGSDKDGLNLYPRSDDLEKRNG